MRRLATDAVAAAAQLVTTEKDFVRLPRTWRRDVLSLPVRLVLSDWSPLDAALDRLGLDDRGPTSDAAGPRRTGRVRGRPVRDHSSAGRRSSISAERSS